MKQDTIIEIPVHSTTQKNKWYKISIDTEKELVECDCWGFLRHGHCRHLTAYKALIQLYMHE